MDVQLEQHATIKFCVWLHKSQKETITLMQEAFGDKCFSVSIIKLWHLAIQNGRQEVKLIAANCGRPKTVVTEVNKNTVAAILEEDQHLSTTFTIECEHISMGVNIYQLLSTFTGNYQYLQMTVNIYWRLKAFALVISTLVCKVIIFLLKMKKISDFLK